MKDVLRDAEASIKTLNAENINNYQIGCSSSKHVDVVQLILALHQSGLLCLQLEYLSICNVLYIDGQAVVKLSIYLFSSL